MIGFRSHKRVRASRLRAKRPLDKVSFARLSWGKVPFAKSALRKPRSRAKLPLFPILFSVAWAVAVPTYVVRVRPWMLTWGATPAEVETSLPGDELIARPRHVWTRAVTIDALPEVVWPWLVQMGQGRGGLYSYDCLENLAGCDIHSLSYIEPALQQLALGDEVRLVPKDYPVDLHLLVARMEPPSTLVLATPGSVDDALTGELPYMTWGFTLRATPEGKTRLISRTRSIYQDSLRSLIANRIALEPIQFVMERKMLLGIKARAERSLEEQIFHERAAGEHVAHGPAVDEAA